MSSAVQVIGARLSVIGEVFLVIGASGAMIDSVVSVDEE
jgi:hypothetical protein